MLLENSEKIWIVSWTTKSYNKVVPSLSHMKFLLNSSVEQIPTNSVGLFYWHFWATSDCGALICFSITSFTVLSWAEQCPRWTSEWSHGTSTPPLNGLQWCLVSMANFAHIALQYQQKLNIEYLYHTSRNWIFLLQVISAGSFCLMLSPTSTLTQPMCVAWSFTPVA